jgi:hypothetical protein
VTIRPSVETALPLLATLALAGCGGDPLVGTWRSTSFPGGMRPEWITSYQSEITFNSNMTASGVTTTVYAASSPVHPGCTEIRRSTGSTWMTSTSGSTMTLTIGGTSTDTVERTGCVNASENQTPMTNTTTSESRISGLTYTIMGNVLTLTITVMGTSITLTYTKV